MLAKVEGVFRLSRDVEIKYTQSGVAIGNLGLVNSEKFTQNGEKKENTCFVDASIFGKMAEIANQYLRKGSQIFISGDLVFEQWVNQQGEKKSRHKIKINQFEMLGGGNFNSGDNNSGYGYAQPQQQASHQSSGSIPVEHEEIPGIDINEDEIPF